MKTTARNTDVMHMHMRNVDDYITASERANTVRSYASAVRHFEVEWQGMLPATAATIAQYLAAHATTLSNNTLRQRLAALSRWHTDQGFTDPTKAAVVRQVLKGIRAVHPAVEKQARSLAVEELAQVDGWLDAAIATATAQDDRTSLLRHTRDRAIVLLGFWRGFRSDELIRLRLENVQVSPGEGLVCYLDRSKTDRNNAGRDYHCPALSRLCPVAAFSAWTSVAALQEGPVFRKIDRWGHIADEMLSPTSLITMLRRLFEAAGLASAQDYSSHSLRRGFAGWARTSGWDIKELMAYVGWKDIKSAMRYLDNADDGLQARFEAGLRRVQVQASIN